MSLMTDIPMMHWLRQADFEHLQGLQNPGDIKVTTPLDFGSNQNAGLISKNDLNQRIGICLSGVGRLRDYGPLSEAKTTIDFLPTFSHIVGGKMPTDRPIDGVDQTDVLLGNSMMGHRESLLSFIGADLVAARWKQWRIYFTDVHPTGIGPQREPGIFSASASMAGYPKVYNIEMDPHEDLVVGGLFSWVTGPALKAVDEYLETVKKYPNPPAPNITQFKNGGG